MPGIICMQAKKFSDYASAEKEMQQLNEQLQNISTVLKQCPFIIICDDAAFTAAQLNNFLWVTFTRCNPSYDIYGVNSFYNHKHWRCDVAILDARIKPHHAPVLQKDAGTEKMIERIFNKGGSLYGLLK